MSKKEGMTKSRFVFLSVFSAVVVLLVVWLVSAITITQTAPAAGNINTSLNINFTFTPTWNLSSEAIANCSLWTNFSGVWEMALETNGSFEEAAHNASSRITNNTLSYINYTFTRDISDMMWSIACYNEPSASGVRTFTSNRTLTIDTLIPDVVQTADIFSGFNTSSVTPTITFTIRDLNGSGINISGQGNTSLNVSLADSTTDSPTILRTYNASNENLTCSPTGQAITNTTCTLNIASFPLTNGTKNITISVTDRVGRTNITSFLFTVDNIPPRFDYFNITNTSLYNTSSVADGGVVKTYDKSDKGSVDQGTRIYLAANWTDNLTMPLRGDWQLYNSTTGEWETINTSNITPGQNGGWLNLSYFIPTGHNVFEGTNVSFRIRANDTVGNMNSTGRNITIQINDTTSPTLLVSSVAGQIHLNGTNTTDTTPTVVWNVTENSSLRSIAIQFDSLTSGSCNQRKNFSQELGDSVADINDQKQGSLTLLDTGSCNGLSNGTHTVRLTAEDDWGNSELYIHSFVVQTGEGMDIKLGMINNSVGGIQHTVNNSNITSTYQLTFNVTLDGGVSTLKRVTWTSDCNTSVTNFTNATAISPFVACSDLQANKTVTIQAYDHVGNSVTRMFSFAIDDVAPVIAVHSPLNGQIFSDISYINVSALDNLGRVTGIGYYLDGNPVLFNHTSALNVSARAGANTTVLNISVNFTAGTHTLKIRVNDTLGNERNSSVITFSQIGPINFHLMNKSLTSYLNNRSYSGQTVNVTLRIKTGGTYQPAETNQSDGTFEIIISLNETKATGVNITLGEVNGSGVNWDLINFSVTMNDSKAQEQIENNRTATILNLVLFNDSLNEFLPLSTNYYGAVKVKFNLTGNASTAEQFWWLEDETDFTSRTNISQCTVAFTKETTTPCWNDTGGGSTIIFVPHFSAVVVINDSNSPNVTIIKPLETQTEGTFTPNITVTSDAVRCNYTVDTAAAKASSNTSMTLSGTTCTASAISVANGTIGNNNITFYVWDDSDNLRATVLNFNVSDLTPHNFTAASASAGSTSATITVTANESVNSTIDYGTEVSLGTAGTPQTDFDVSQQLSLSGLTSSKLHYYNVTTCDKAGNCIENGTFNFTTSAAAAAAESSSSSSGSSGGGAAAAATTTAASQTAAWNKVDAGETVTWSITNEKIAVKGVEFSVKEGVTSASVKVSSLKSKPADVAEVPKVYQYLEIKATNVGATNVEKGTVTFDVPKSWLTENGVSESAVALLRHADGQWNELSTSVKSSTSTAVTYTATTPGFSYFAIGTKAAAPSEATPGEAVPSEAAPAGETKPLPITPPGAAASTIGWVITIVVLIIIIAVVVARRKKK